MNLIQRIRRPAGVVCGLVGASVTLTAAAPAALAMRVPPPGDPGGVPPSAPAQIHIVMTGGMPGWEITLIALAAALLAAVAAVFFDRAWATRRPALHNHRMMPAPDAAGARYRPHAGAHGTPRDPSS
jgi:hypothetical protein